MKVENKGIAKETEITIEDQIKEWKAEHKKIFKSVINGKDYIWRRIKRSEYTDAIAVQGGEDLDESVFLKQAAMLRKVILNVSPEELEEDLMDLPGLAGSIADDMLERSGFAYSPSREL